MRISKKLKRYVYSVLTLVAVGFVCLYLYNTSDIDEGVSEVVSAPIATMDPVYVPEGWSVYRNDDFGVTFAYPSTWTVEEQRVTGASNRAAGSNQTLGKLQRAIFRGDGYTIVLHRDGRGLSDDSGKSEYSFTEFPVGGFTARTFEKETESGYMQHLNVSGKNTYVLFTIVSEREKAKDLTNQILSTVTFYTSN